ncbi:unnamed protein product [Orchesella dallaii]|uniref:F-box domain-containing protein n=1 Tax=Orchesella dallaii TaxID=48710 RepID=A0ABP1RQP3_9HEXA
MNKRVCSSSTQASRVQPGVQAPTQGSLEPTPMDGGDNPMLLYPVLKKIFESRIFNRADLKNFRLVCKEWSNASLERWRKEATLTLTDDPPPSHNGDNSASENSKTKGLTLSEFLDMVDMPGDPFQLLQTNKFRSYNIKFSQDLCLSQPDRRIFWDKIGPLMTHLNISNSKISSVQDLAEILFQDIPNLEDFAFVNDFPLDRNKLPYPFGSYEAQMHGFMSNWDDRLRPLSDQILTKLTKLDINLKSKCFPLSWVYFLGRVPNIKELTLRSFSTLFYEAPTSDGEFDLTNDLEELVRSLVTVRETLGPSYFSQLKGLHLLNFDDSGRFQPFLLEPLRDLRLGITFLSFDITPIHSVIAFREMLRMYSDTLEKLNIFRAHKCNTHRTHLPLTHGVELLHLKELYLSDQIFGNLDFKKNLSNLRTLELDYCSCLRNCTSYDFSSGDLQNVVLPLMQELLLSKELCRGVIVKKLGRLMPNLKKLRIGLGSNGFTTLCKTWKDLESLEIEPNAVTESAILGGAGDRKYSVPNITDLKELTSFTMGHSEPGTAQGQLSNDSIVYGILACEKLKHVSIADPSKASKEVKEMLTSKFPQKVGW